MASRFAESECDYTTGAGPSKPKRASESKLVNWKNVGDEFDFTEVTKDNLNPQPSFTKPQIQSRLSFV